MPDAEVGTPQGESPSSIGAHIRHLREARGISKREMAKVLGIDKNSVTLYESDDHHLRFRWARKMARYMEVSLNELVPPALRSERRTMTYRQHPRRRRARTPKGG